MLKELVLYTVQKIQEYESQITIAEDILNERIVEVTNRVYIIEERREPPKADVGRTWQIEHGNIEVTLWSSYDSDEVVFPISYLYNEKDLVKFERDSTV